MGCEPGFADRVLSLLEDTELLHQYLRKAKRAGCIPLSRVSEGYPDPVRNRLGLEAPGCLWAKGDLSLLERPAVALVGSRDLEQDHECFAREVGRQAALQGFVLVSGNARGADRAAQEACLAAGGQVICVVADELARHELVPGMLYLSEDGFDLPFSSQRALSRNRIIHCLGLRTFVARCGLRQGGTWDGTMRNLSRGWSLVYCFDDGSESIQQLIHAGAEPVLLNKLHDFAGLPVPVFRIFDQW